jgi:hypothetical protein
MMASLCLLEIKLVIPSKKEIWIDSGDGGCRGSFELLVSTFLEKDQELKGGGGLFSFIDLSEQMAK